MGLALAIVGSVLDRAKASGGFSRGASLLSLPYQNSAIQTQYI